MGIIGRPATPTVEVAAKRGSPTPDAQKTRQRKRSQIVRLWKNIAKPAHRAHVPEDGSAVAEAVLRAELARLEDEWATERSLLVEQLSRKDETIWSLVRQQAGPQRTPSMVMGRGPDESGRGSPPPDKAEEVPVWRKQASRTVAREQEAEVAELAWRASQVEAVDWSEEEDEVTTPISEAALEQFESELSEMNRAHARQHSSVTADLEAFKAGDQGCWSCTVACKEGTLWARGDASQVLLKGCVLLPGVHAPALFDYLLELDTLGALLPATIVSASVLRSPSPVSWDGQQEPDNELLRAVLQPAFSYHKRELFMWRALRRRPHSGTYLMALRNGPPSQDATTGLAANGERPAEGLWQAVMHRAVKPAALIGSNGLLVSHAELPDGSSGARLCFAWCCELPGNATAPSRLKASLGLFPQVTRDLLAKAKAQAPVDYARRAELMDTTGDGIPNALALDTVGDGAVDTMVHLEGLASTSAGGEAGTAVTRRGSTQAGGARSSMKSGRSSTTRGSITSWLGFGKPSPTTTRPPACASTPSGAQLGRGSTGAAPPLAEKSSPVKARPTHPLFGRSPHYPTAPSRHETKIDALPRPPRSAHFAPDVADYHRPERLSSLESTRSYDSELDVEYDDYYPEAGRGHMVSPRRSVRQHKSDRDGFIGKMVDVFGLGGL